MTDYKLIEKIGKLIEAIKEASDAGGGVAKALNRLTFWGVIVAGMGVLVALGALVFEIFKYFYANV